MRCLLLWLVLAACGGGGGGGDGSLSVDDFGNQSADAYCAKIFTCCSSADRSVVFAGTQVTDQGSCNAYYRALYTMFASARLHASISAGRLDYDSAAASGCLAATGALGCAEFSRTAGANDCASPFTGQVADGTSCAYDQECASGYCEGDVEIPVAVNGTCKALPGQGQSCPDDLCAAHLQCASGSCQPLLADGSTCTAAGQCTSQGCNGADGMGGSGTCGVPTSCDGM